MITYWVFVRTARETGVRKRKEKVEKGNGPCSDNDNERQGNWPGGMGGTKNVVKEKKKEREVIYWLGPEIVENSVKHHQALPQQRCYLRNSLRHSHSL